MRFAARCQRARRLGDLSAKEAARLDRLLLLALAAARRGDRRTRARSVPARVARERVGVAIGSGIGGLETLFEDYTTLLLRGPRRVSPVRDPDDDRATWRAGYVSIRHGLRGPNLCHVSACTTGAHAIGESLRTDRARRRGRDARGRHRGAARPARRRRLRRDARALACATTSPPRASRPFDLDRDGFVIGRGRRRRRARGARARARARRAHPRRGLRLRHDGRRRTPGAAARGRRRRAPLHASSRSPTPGSRPRTSTT